MIPGTTIRASPGPTNLEPAGHTAHIKLVSDYFGTPGSEGLPGISDFKKRKLNAKLTSATISGRARRLQPAVPGNDGRLIVKVPTDQQRQSETREHAMIFKRSLPARRSPTCCASIRAGSTLSMKRPALILGRRHRRPRRRLYISNARNGWTDAGVLPFANSRSTAS
jgi:hypothetical protein